MATLRRVRALETRAVRGLAAGTIALGLVGGCGDDATDGTPATTNEDLHDTGHDVESDASTTAIEDPEGSDGSGAAAPGDTDGGESTDGADSDNGDTGESEPECVSGPCQTVCTGTNTYDLGDEICTCDAAPTAPDYVGCDLPETCFSGDTLCQIESIRDGVVGSYYFDYPIGEMDSYMLSIQVFAPGRARVYEGGYTHDCCGDSHVNSYGRYYHVQDIPLSDDPIWDDCIAGLDELGGAPPPCLDPGVLLRGACEPFVTECPAAG